MTTEKKIQMEHGAMTVYENGGLRLHAYRTDDPIADEVFIVEGPEGAVTVELPCFKDSIAALEKYVSGNNIEVKARIVAYHAAGGSFLKGVPVYGTPASEQYGTNGGGKALIDRFAGIFGEAFDASVPQMSCSLKEGRNIIAGIEMDIIPNGEAFGIAFPALNAVYIHMIGHDCHSIVAGAAHADAMIAELRGFLDSGVEMFLTSHHDPEGPADVEEKIAYLQDLKGIASECSSAEQFMTEVGKKYPAYAGGNYLEMTAGFFFS